MSETLKLEVGRSYIRRDGKTAKCVYWNRHEPEDPFLVDHPKGVEWHYPDGKWQQCIEHAKDLIRPADEPPPLVVPNSPPRGPPYMLSTTRRTARR